VPASFPSIYIGANGDTQNGNFLDVVRRQPAKQVSAIGSAQTKPHLDRRRRQLQRDLRRLVLAEQAGGRYKRRHLGLRDGVALQAGQNQPIGSVARTASIAGQDLGRVGSESAEAAARTPTRRSSPTWPQGGSVSTLSFDLKAFITDAASSGISSSWYLTDVFAGFEIWDGNGTTNLGVTEFTAKRSVTSE
jgi:hypothetical protein